MSIVSVADVKQAIKHYTSNGFLFVGIDENIYILVSNSTIIGLKKFDCV